MSHRDVYMEFDANKDITEFERRKKREVKLLTMISELEKELADKDKELETIKWNMANGMKYLGSR